MLYKANGRAFMRGFECSVVLYNPTFIQIFSNVTFMKNLRSKATQAEAIHAGRNAYRERGKRECERAKRSQAATGGAVGRGNRGQTERTAQQATTEQVEK